jgi:hypothetical protein
MSPRAALARGLDHTIHALTAARVAICPHADWADLDIVGQLRAVTPSGAGHVTIRQQVCTGCLTETRLAALVDDTAS